MVLKRSVVKGKADEAAIGEIEVHGWKSGPSASRTASDVQERAADEPAVKSVRIRKRSATSAGSSDSNPDALGIDDSEKGIYDALKKIAELPPSLSRGGDRLVDSTTGTVDSQALGEADGKSLAAGTDKQSEDRPKSPSATVIVDPSLQDVVQQEAEKPVEGSTAYAQEILGCHASLLLEKVATLERSSQEQSEKIKRLEARVEALEQDNSALKDNTSKLQEKVKATAKEKKELKSLLLRKDNEVTDLTNIVYRHADAVEKLTKIKDDADKQMVSDMKQIR
ncbi:uncharacterized protein LOC120685053 [Panicum virgatum]|uniref:uncharacterized protein LOC120685053 n=1 Tax=Panicum virgatum TaxID=38727 RepID=UPI0019D670E0|nr:uncharacterized protein LOC120685053 [Panicum virgatum]